MARFPAWIRRTLHHTDHTNVERAIGPDLEQPTNQHIPTAGELRGIPAIGRNVQGAVPGTNPGDNLK